MYREYSSPNDSPKDGTIHQIAQDQLAKWEVIAAKWPIFEAEIDHRWGVHCGECLQTIWFRSDLHGNQFMYTKAMKSALIVAHIRQNHERDFINGTV